MFVQQVVFVNMVQRELKNAHQAHITHTLKLKLKQIASLVFLVTIVKVVIYQNLQVNVSLVTIVPTVQLFQSNKPLLQVISL